MRFMLIVKPPANAYTTPPKPEQFATMGRFNDELRRAGVLLELNGLTSPAAGAKVKFHADKRSTVVDGPFAESKELVGGYWIIQVRSKEEAVEWAKRAPFADVHPGEEVEVEVRQIQEMDDLPKA